MNKQGNRHIDIKPFVQTQLLGSDSLLDTPYKAEPVS